MEATPMNGFLTTLSIRAAITTFLLVGLLQAQNSYAIIPRQQVANRFLAWDAIWLSPRACIFLLVASVLGLSLIATMAALLCTDYSLRFEWPRRRDRGANRVQLVLRQKAHQFNVIGFYCLMWSLAAATALVDYVVAFTTALVVFLVMWSYYFFPEGENYSMVPAVRGLSAIEARDAIENAGLVPRDRVVRSAIPKDQVIRQDMLEGTDVPPGTEVRFEVSGGL
jgi:hypothetical protein